MGFIDTDTDMGEISTMPQVNTDRDDQLEAVTALIKNLQEELADAKRQLKSLQEKNEELKRLSITDDLTGLYNQRHFHDRLEEEVAKDTGQKHSLCLLFFDVDNLKSYNDTHGHSGGNDVLKAVAQSLFQNTEDNVNSGYRYGGDEFAVILPEAHADEAEEVATRINRCLWEAGFQDVTLSFGIAELGTGIDSQALFRHADEAMYMAKELEGTKPNTRVDKIFVYGSDCGKDPK
jgi:diguanylate cyclase (GGDEF)-like protein